jgi:thiamine biosynthesis lipoprotein
MGTTYSVKVVAARLPDDVRQRIAASIETRLSAVNRLMSTYDPDSELSRFNGFASTEPFAVSAKTLDVFGVAQEVSKLTGGAFDVTVGPLVEGWGFGATDRVPAAPPADELAALRARVGYRRVRIDPAARTLAKTHPETVCDLSAITTS